MTRIIKKICLTSLILAVLCVVAMSEAPLISSVAIITFAIVALRETLSIT